MSLSYEFSNLIMVLKEAVGSLAKQKKKGVQMLWDGTLALYKDHHAGMYLMLFAFDLMLYAKWFSAKFKFINLVEALCNSNLRGYLVPLDLRQVT